MIRNQVLHDVISEFLQEVGKTKEIENYRKIAKKYIYRIGNTLGLGNEFINYCESLEVFESILFPIRGYREHFVHQLNVFLNGYLILNWLDNKQFEKLKGIVASRSKHTEDVDIFKIWFITAAFHDIGYPLGKTGDWMEEFLKKMFKISIKAGSKVKESLSVQLFRENFRESLESLIQYLFLWLRLTTTKEKKIRKKIYDLFFDNLSENLIAALVLLRASGKEKLNTCTLSSAISSIVLDDKSMWEILNQMEKPISYVDHPIAFLLVYCDNIQEHGRPKSAAEGRIVFPQNDPFGVEKEIPTLSGRKDCVHWHLYYKQKPPFWRQKVEPMLNTLRECWIAPGDLPFQISYRDRGGKCFYPFAFRDDKSITSR